MTAPPLESVLERLQKVRRIDSSRWFARCPAHQETTGSLSIRYAPGSPPYALHCFGCGAGTRAVLAALGFEDAPGAPIEAPPIAEEGTPAWWAQLRADAIRLARGQPWNREEHRLRIAAADLHRAMLDTIEYLNRTAEALGPDRPATWELLSRAADLESERRLLEQAMDARG